MEEVPILHALVELAVQSSYLRSQPHPLHRLAAVVEAAGGAHRVRYREAEDLIPVVHQLAGGTMRVRRRPVLDEYVDGDESAVMVGDQVVVLSALATTLLALIGDEETETAFLAQQLIKRYGPPSDDLDGLKSTQEALNDLETNGLVQLIRDIR